MSQAIQGPVLVPSPYQWTPQQQASATMPSSSLGMPGDSISPVAIGLGVTAGGLLTAAAVTLAVKHFSASGDKPKPAQATSLTSKPVKREVAAQIESAPASTQEIPFPQPTPPPQYAPPYQSTRQYQSVPSHQPALSPLPQGQLRPGRALPGYVDNSGVYREQQNREDVLCVKHAMNTVLYEVFGAEEFEEKIITDEEFREAVPEELLDGDGARLIHLVKLANRRDLGVTVYHTARLDGASIPGIDDVRAFIIVEPRALGRLHAMAMVRPEVKKVFSLSDSGDQNEDEVYPVVQPADQDEVRRTATASEAFLDYQRRNNITARAVITFHKRIFANGPEYGVNNFRI